MSAILNSRICREPFKRLIVKPEETIKFFKNGQSVGWSGFTPSGYPKAVPIALANHVKENNLQGKLRFKLLSGASVGSETADIWAELNMIESYMPYQSGKNLNKAINKGLIAFQDIHLSNFPDALINGHYKSNIDIAIIEATEITKEGGIILGAAGGVAQEVCDLAEKVIIEVNTSIPSYRGVHDIVQNPAPPSRFPFLITRVDDRIGKPHVVVDPEKIIAIVESTHYDNGRPLSEPNDSSLKIAEHIINFLEEEVSMKRLPQNLLSLQSGVGNIANAVISGLASSRFENVTMWTEVLQDTVLNWFDTGKLRFASTTAVSLSVPGFQRFYKNWDHYAPKIIIRPQFISNHPENIRRLGVIAMNTPIEIDIYGHVNSSHVMGSRVINGIGGSGDFLRNSFLSITHTPSIRPTPSDPTGISCFVPFCSHIDHTEHDVLIYVSEQGLADCRRLDPRARARAIITNCSHPDYKEQLLSYLEMAESECERTGSMHQPHMLRKAFLMHQNFLEKGTMKLSTWN
ncbi:uncharacterized protein LOC135145855 [Zophobas morio]|uniref:uncharacterized protein LOC135145855 n=1 Tax=Zophobas morio TaxID=2755281 RepID=UPI003082E579